jgi:DNA-binding MarR family transcriptional regulator
MDDDRRAPARLRALPSWLVSRTALQAARLVGEQLAEAGVTRRHFSVLVALEDGGPTSQAALGRRLGLDRSDLHAIVGALERDGLVERRRDPADARRNLVRLTPKGRGAIKRLDARVQAAQDALLAPLDDAERRRLIALLTRVVEHHAEAGAPPDGAPRG